jgi:hypothetical protein
VSTSRLGDVGNQLAPVRERVLERGECDRLVIGEVHVQERDRHALGRELPAIWRPSLQLERRIGVWVLVLGLEPPLLPQLLTDVFQKPQPAMVGVDDEEGLGRWLLQRRLAGGVVGIEADPRPEKQVAVRAHKAMPLAGEVFDAESPPEMFTLPVSSGRSTRTPRRIQRIPPVDMYIELSLTAWATTCLRKPAQRMASRHHRIGERTTYHCRNRCLRRHCAVPRRVAPGAGYRDCRVYHAGAGQKSGVSREQIMRSLVQQRVDLRFRAPSGTRTPNPLIKSQLLCQLS